MKKRVALISVYHKNGIVEFAKELISLNFDIYASGGTAKHLAVAGVAVIDVSSLVGGEAILGHRVVTLSREVHAGLLAKNNLIDLKELENLGIPFINLACVDLYPLEAEIKKADSTPESVIEQTDIGGPTMLRSAAKGRRIVVCAPEDRKKTIEWLKAGSPNESEYLNYLAAKAEATIAKYCLISANYHSQDGYKGFIGSKHLTCKYGENGHQTPAALYKDEGVNDLLAIHNFKLVAGDKPSYNNLCDLDRLLQTMTHIAASFDKNLRGVPNIALGAKHGNCCGAAIDDDPEEVIRKMVNGDPIAIFGGLLMFNFTINESQAEIIVSDGPNKKRLLDGIIAAGFTEGAIEILARKKGKCRLLSNPYLELLTDECLDSGEIFRYVRGGFLSQPNYNFILNLSDPNLKKYGPALSIDEESDLLLAKAICDTSNSNTITLVRNGQLIGNGVGQQTRVRAAKLAGQIAKDCKHSIPGASAASDSFFPFVDGPEALDNLGVTTIVTSSGSVNDAKIIDFCNLNEMSLYMIPDSIGRGFYNH
ncbi:MAG: hypothetical protein WCN88_03270 [Candidatus Falkowbacteria bacterium]